jgi:DNA-binding transcriptional regulator YdaS (Cro superfamily)
MNEKAASSIQEAIKITGGAKQFAYKVGVSYKTVLDWKNGRTGISPLNCIKIEQATGGAIKAKDIAPLRPWEK